MREGVFKVQSSCLWTTNKTMHEKHTLSYFLILLVAEFNVAQVKIYVGVTLKINHDLLLLSRIHVPWLIFKGILLGGCLHVHHVLYL
jgi:hypothetical protein